MKKFAFAISLMFFLFFVLVFFQTKNNGDLVLVGGSKMPPGLIDWVVSRKPVGKILLVSNDGILGKKWDVLFLTKETIETVFPEQLTFNKLKNVGAIFIDGGHQYEYIRRLNPKVIQHAHENGILILGTSAGAMILGEFYFSAKHGGITSEEALANPNEHRICVESNFLKIKSLKKTIVDSHYAERDRQGRLLVFIDKANDKGLNKGIGIDESTALCIKKNLECEVIGLGSVYFVTKTTQGNSCTSLCQGDTSKHFHFCEYLDQK